MIISKQCKKSIIVLSLMAICAQNITMVSYAGGKDTCSEPSDDGKCINDCILTHEDNDDEIEFICMVGTKKLKSTLKVQTFYGDVYEEIQDDRNNYRLVKKGCSDDKEYFLEEIGDMN